MKFSFLMSALVAIVSQTACASVEAKPNDGVRYDYGFQRVIWVVLENTDVKDAVKEPYLKELMQKGAFFANMNGESHPSQPNYIAMISGNTHGVTGDYFTSVAGNHIGDLLESHGRTWKNYAEDFPGNCYPGSIGNYVRRHVPFVLFSNVTENAQRCANIVNADQFDKDLASNHLPDYVMYTPNLLNDGHNTKRASVLRRSFRKSLGHCSPIPSS